MTIPATPRETTLQKEQRLFQELVPRLIDAFLNRFFDLRPEKSLRRRRYLILLFLIIGFVVSLREYPLYMWVQYVQDIYNFLFTIPGEYTSNFRGNPFDNFIGFGFQALSDPHTLQYLPLLLASFFIALQSAAIYLADIFELEDVSVARKFVGEVALAGSDETIRITQGDIFEDHRSSPNYLIGGPGKVIVDIDSVALFEKPDGTPRVIGPTGKEPGGKATLDGFERFRQAIDLRDHYIELRDQNDKASSVKSRSRDGIPVTATDVRFMFSVYRDKQKPDDKNPYPFSREAIEQLVYKATSRVTPDLTNPSTFEFSWINNMIGLIRGKLGGFMNERNLTEYLASIGMPEFEKALQEEENIAKEIQSLASATTDEPPKAKEVKPPADFVPRYMVKKNLFDQFTEEFAKTTRERGVELHWIGVGTWKTPIEVVPEKHLEAWKLSRENEIKGSQKTLDALKIETTIQETMILIQEAPIEAYQTATETYTEHDNAIKFILEKYRQQLIEAAEFVRAKGEDVSQEIISAIENLSKALGYADWHWVGKTQSITGRNETEDDLYNNLLNKVGGDRPTANRLIEFERKQFPLETRSHLIRRAIERLDRDRQ